MSATTYTACNQCNQVNRVPSATDDGKKPVCGRCKTELSIHEGMSDLNAPALDALIKKSELPVVVDFWAAWCQPCKMFAPVFKQGASKMAGQVVFAKVDSEANPTASAQYKIRGIPTLILFQNGIEIARHSGALPPETFIQWLQTQLDLSTAA